MELLTNGRLLMEAPAVINRDRSSYSVSWLIVNLISCKLHERYTIANEPARHDFGMIGFVGKKYCHAVDYTYVHDKLPQ